MFFAADVEVNFKQIEDKQKLPENLAIALGDRTSDPSTSDTKDIKHG